MFPQYFSFTPPVTVLFGLSGYTGDVCEINIDDCAEGPCLNGGTCEDAVNAFFCECIDGFIGVRCEENVNDCKPNPCKNGAHCRFVVANTKSDEQSCG